MDNSSSSSSNIDYIAQWTSILNDTERLQLYMDILEESQLFTLNSGLLTLQQISNTSLSSVEYSLVRNVSAFNHPVLVVYPSTIEDAYMLRSYLWLNRTHVNSSQYPIDSVDINKKYLKLDHFIQGQTRDRFQNSNMIIAFILVCSCVGTWVVVLVTIMLFSTKTTGSVSNNNNNKNTNKNKNKNKNNKNNRNTVRTSVLNSTRSNCSTDTMTNDTELKKYNSSSSSSSSSSSTIGSSNRNKRLKLVIRKIIRCTKTVYDFAIFQNSVSNTGFFALYLWFASISFSVMLDKTNNLVFVEQYYKNYQDSVEYTTVIKNSVWYKVIFLFLQILCDLNWFEIAYFLKNKTTPSSSINTPISNNPATSINKKRQRSKRIMVLVGLSLTVMNLASFVIFMFLFPNSRTAFSIFYGIKLLMLCVFIFACILPFAYKQYSEICFLDKYQRLTSDAALNSHYDDNESTGDETSYHGGLKTLQVNKIIKSQVLQSFTFYKKNLPLVIYNFSVIVLLVSLYIATLITYHYDNNWLDTLVEFVQVIVTFNLWTFIGLLFKQEKTYTKMSILGKKIRADDHPETDYSIHINTQTTNHNGKHRVKKKTKTKNDSSIWKKFTKANIFTTAETFPVNVPKLKTIVHLETGEIIDFDRVVSAKKGPLVTQEEETFGPIADNSSAWSDETHLFRTDSY